MHDDLEWAAAEGKDPEEWECVACGKIFRSEAAWDSHERSKKHMKEVERLTREIQEEDEGLDLEGQGQTTMVTMPEEEQDILESKSSSPPTEVETELESDPGIPCTDQEVEVSVDEEEQRSSGRQKKPSKTHINLPLGLLTKTETTAESRTFGDETATRRFIKQRERNFEIKSGHEQMLSPVAAEGERLEFTKRERRRVREARKNAEVAEIQVGKSIRIQHSNN